MPPVTTQSRIFYNNSWKNSNPGKDMLEEESHSPPSPRKRRPRNNSKSYSKNYHKKSSKQTNGNGKSDSKKTYDRDTLLNLRQSPLSNQKLSDLPIIPGVTAPRLKKKEMPDSLRQKLLKRGVVIRESSSDEDCVEKECKKLDQLSIKDDKSFDCDVIWQSCMLHLI